MPHQPSNHTPQFSTREQWLVHDVMLSRLGYGPDARTPTADPYVCEFAVVTKLESTDPSFTRLELDRIKTVCLDYADRAATVATDRALALDVVERINTRLHAAPSRHVNHEPSTRAGQ